MNPRLFRALVHGGREELERIIQLHADPEARRSLLRGVTPDGDAVLHVAARFGHHDLVRYVYLGENPVGGAFIDLTARNNRGDTALHCAATEEMVRLLLFELAPRYLPAGQRWRFAEMLRARNHGGETCLHEAVRCGREGVVRVLVDRDDIVEDSSRPLAQIVDGEGVSPLYLAATLDRVGSTVFHEIITILTAAGRRYRASYDGPQGRTALHAAVLVNCTIICRALLDWDAGTDRHLIRQADESGSTPLHYLASSRSAAAIARLFLQRGEREEANTSAAYCADSRGSLPVHVAAGHGRLDIIRLLLEECPDCLWSRNSCGQTFLHVAVQKERSDVVAYICSLQHDDRMFTTAILNARDHDGNTALHLAVLSANQPVLFRLLLRRKEVDLNIANREGHTPLDLVFLSGKVAPDITGTEGHIPNPLDFLMSGQRTFRYTQNRYDRMVYDLVIAGAYRGVHRWDDMTTRFPANQDVEKDWEKVGKSAGVLAVCAVLILNATLVLPSNVAARYNNLEQPLLRRRALAFRAFLALDAVAFVSSAVATFSCTYAGFATAENVLRRWQLFFGADCLVAASFAIVSAFSLGMYAEFGTGLMIFPTLAVLFLNVGFLSGIALPFQSTIQHNLALHTRLGTGPFLRSLFRTNHRMLCRFCRRHKVFLFLAFVLVVYCIFIAITIIGG